MKFNISWLPGRQQSAAASLRSARPSAAAASAPAQPGIAAQRARIQAIFDGARRAAARTGNAAATVELIKARLVIDDMKKTPPVTRALHRLGIRKSPDSRTAKIDDMLPLFHKGVLGKSGGLEEEKQGWHLPAWLEGLHTIAGSRLWYVFGALGIEEVHDAGEKIAINQACGPVLQAPASAYFRIATEVLQVLLNKGGRPKLPPEAGSNTASLKDTRREFRSVRAALTQANAQLRQALADASAPGATACEFDRLRMRREQVAQAMARMKGPDTAYNYRFFRFKREYFGKRWSALVSVFTSAVGAPLKKFPFASMAVKIAAVPLQAVASRFDFVRAQEYTLRGAAKKVELRSLLKPESRHKPLDQVTEADIDITTAGRFYDEQPQLILAKVREIYTHKLAELTYRRLALEEEIAGTANAKKAGELREVNARLAALKAQIGHFERGETERIDPQATIGKALVDPWYFFRKGTNAVFLNKVGEFWAQHHQRIFNSFNPFISLGQVAILTDVLNAVDSHHAGLRGLEDPPVRTVLDDIQKAGPVYGANSGITVIFARDNKVHNDRRKLGVPGRIAKPAAVAPGTIEDELADAVNKGLLSEKGKKKIGKAAMAMQSAPPGSRRRRKAEAALHGWEALKKEAEAFAAKINKDWIVTDIAGKDGKPLRIDLRTSAACFRKNMPLAQRIWIPVRNIPRGMIYPATMLHDAARARHARHRAHQAAGESQRLMAQASGIEGKAPPRLTLDLDMEDLLTDFTWPAMEAALRNGDAPALSIDDLRPGVLPPADYRRCIAAMREDLRMLDERDPDALGDAERKQAGEELARLCRSARALQLLAESSRVRALLAPGDDTHREWEQTAAQLRGLMATANTMQARLADTENAIRHAKVF